MSEQHETTNVEALIATIKLKNTKELQSLIIKASNLTSQLKETLRQIDNFNLET